MNRLLALLSLLVGCSHANAADSIRLTVEGPMGMVAGDTLAYTISWTAPVVVAGVSSAATGYSLTLSATSTNGAWTVVADSNAAVGKFTSSAGPLPNTANVTSLALKMWLSAIPWDSATFTATLVARNSGGSSSPATATWKVRHKIFPPGTPGTPTVDSSITVVGVLVLPNPATIALGAQRTECAFQQFVNGAVSEWSRDKAACDSIYTTRVSASARSLVSPAQQSHTDSIALTCVSWMSSAPLALAVAPQAPCSSAATLTGLALTQRRDVLPLFRDVRWRELNDPVFLYWPVGRDHVNIKCLRAGTGMLWARDNRTGVVRGQPIKCVGLALPTLVIREVPEAERIKP